MAGVKVKLTVSNKFQFLVVFAFLCSVILGALSLYGLDKFYKTFHDYKTFAEKEKVVITLSKNLLIRERLIQKYFQTYENTYIREVQENHQKIIDGFNSLSNIALTTAQQELTQKNLLLYQQNVSNLEKLFMVNGELLALQKQKLNLEQYFIGVLQSVYMQTQDSTAKSNIEELMNSILGISYTTNLHLISHVPADNVEKELSQVTQAIQKFTLDHPHLLQQDEVFKKNLTYYIKLTEDFNKLLSDYRVYYKTFNDNNLLQVDSSLVELELAFYNNQRELYSKWSTKHSVTWHMAVVIGVFSLVTLAWLMVALSQLFSIKK